MKLSKRIRWIALLAALTGIGVFWVFSNRKFSSTTVRQVEVKINSESDHTLISEEDVLGFLKHSELVLTGMQTDEIDLDYVERSLLKFPFVSDSRAYLDYSGTLHFEVTERTPILRVAAEAGTGYYIDAQGVPFPLSTLHTARVPVATVQYTDSSLNNKLYMLGSYVQESELWKHTIQHIFVRSSGDLAFITRLGPQEVILGNTDRLEAKMEKLLEFYRTASVKLGWNRYSEINLKYRDQIICK